MDSELWREHVVTDEEGLQWIPAAVAAAMLPSTRPGKKVHINTIHRLIRAERLEGRERPSLAGNRHAVYVRLDQVRGLTELKKVKREPVPGPARQKKHTREVLGRMNGKKARAKA